MAIKLYKHQTASIKNKYSELQQTLLQHFCTETKDFLYFSFAPNTPKTILKMLEFDVTLETLIPSLHLIKVSI